MPFTFKLSKRLALMKASLVPAAAAALAACQLQDRRGITDPTLPSSAVMQVVTSPDIAPPIASWKLDEGAGSTAADASGNGNTATLGGGSSWTPGLVGSAVLLDGVSGQLSVPSSPSLNLAGAFSVAAWVKPDAAMADFRAVVVKNYTYFLYASVSGYCGNGGVLAGFATTTVCTATPLPVNAWTHLAVTYDGTTLSLFRNGVLVASRPASGAVPSSTATLQIGASQFGEYFNGLIDEVRLYDRALSTADVQALWGDPILGATSSDGTPPSVPAGLTTTAASSTQINLSWTASTDNVAVTAYKIFRGGLEIGTTVPTSYFDTGLSASTAYTYTVSALNAAGNSSAQSASASATTQVTAPSSGPAYYVSPTGNDAVSCGQAQNIATPKRTLNNAVGCLTPGTTLLVRGGTYAEALLDNIPAGTSWSAPVTLKAYPNETVTMLPPTGSIRVIEFSGAQQYIVIDGLILDGSNSSYDVVKMQGGAVQDPNHIRFVNSEVRNASTGRNGVIDMATNGVIGGNEYINLKVHHNGGPYSSLAGHGFYIATPNNLIDGCDFYNNGYNGIQIQYAGARNNIVRNTRSHDNSVSGITADHLPDGTLIYNNVVYGNGGAGIQVDYGITNTYVYNNTVYNNGTGGFGFAGIWVRFSTNAVVRNNVSFGNGGPGNYADLGTGTLQDHNLFGSDPLFVNAAAGDFRLQSGSPAIDAGATIPLVTMDFSGMARLQGAGYDIGAFER